jgi:hypothetical protein
MKITYTYARLLLTLLLSSTVTYGMFWSCCKKSSVIETSKQPHKQLSQEEIERKYDKSSKDIAPRYVAPAVKMQIIERQSEQSEEGEWV